VQVAAIQITVNDLLEVPTKADTRDTTAVKRIATAYLKLLFPNVNDASNIDKDDFRNYCLIPAIEKRQIIRRQIHLIDEEFSEEMPDIRME
jgi:ATP-dependent Lon protease